MERVDERDTDPLSRRIDRFEDEVETLTERLRATDGSGAALRDRFEVVAGELQALLAESNGGHGAINTRTGGTITPLEPDPADVSIDDVAHALSNLTRFTGQGAELYSVARHAVHVSHEVEARGGSPEAVRWGLLHDATEAYLADVPAPVKRSLPGYTHAEARLADTVREAFDLTPSSEAMALVDVVDSDIGRYELAGQFPERDHDRPSLEVEPADLDRDVDDETLFRRRARELDCA